jgi:hypothetical protein
MGKFQTDIFYAVRVLRRQVSSSFSIGTGQGARQLHQARNLRRVEAPGALLRIDGGGMSEQMTITDPQLPPIVVNISYVTPGYFNLYRTKAAAGRLFEAAES